MTEQYKKDLVFYSGLATALYLAESFLPYPVPGVRAGLSNAVTLLVLFKRGAGLAARVFLVRLVAGSLLTGSFLGPAFFIGGAGGLAALAVMTAVRKVQLAAGRDVFSIYGVSVLGAAAHNGAQYLAVRAFFFPVPGMGWYLPVLAVSAVAAGIVTAKLAVFLSGIEREKK